MVLIWTYREGNELSKYMTNKLPSLDSWRHISALLGQLPHSTKALIHKWLYLYSEITNG